VINPFSDLGKETQNPFLDTRIRIWIFPKKRTRTSTIGLDSFTDDSELKELCAVYDVTDPCGKLDLSGGAKGWICP